jgi:hypothetical protein
MIATVSGGQRSMLLQTNSYVVPKDKRTEHARLVKRFKQVMARLGLTDFEVYEQAGPNWSTEVGGRFVQIMRFRDREHQKAVRDAESADGTAQDLVREFCELVNFNYQHQNGIATTAFYLGAHMTGNPSTGGAPKRLPGGDEAAPAGLAGTPESHAADTDEANEGGNLGDVTKPSAFRSGKPARATSNGDVDD